MMQILDSRYDEIVNNNLKQYRYAIPYGVEMTSNLVRYRLGILNSAISSINSAIIRSGITVSKDETFVGSLDELSSAVVYASSLALSVFQRDGSSEFYSTAERLEHGIFADIGGFEPVSDGRTLPTPFNSRDDFYAVYMNTRSFIESVASIDNDGEPFILFDKKNNVLLSQLCGVSERSDAISITLTQVPRLGQVFATIEYIALCYVAIALEFQTEYGKVADDLLSAMLDSDTSTIEKEGYVPFIFTHRGLNEKFYPDSSEVSDKSTEDMPINASQKNINIGNIDENYKSRWLKIQKIYIENFKIKASEKLSKKNASFFKDYYGRIPHLYEQYANRAPIYENTMNGDPTELLSTKAVEYVTNMSDDATQLFNELIGMAKKLASATDITTKLNVVKSYCKKFPIDDSDPYTLKKQINDETAFRIATSILRDVKIYGYTIEGIVENGKFPPANHIVTSIFVTNPHEKPFEQKVSDIFSNPENMLIYAKPGEIVKFENLYRETSMKILNSFDHRSVSVAQKNMVQSTKSYGNRMKRADGITGSETFDPKDQKKLAKLIESSVIAAIDMVVDQKQRCMQCVGVVHDMIARVTDLAMRCVVSMRNVEKENSDKNVKDKDFYNSGNEYRQHNKTQVALDANKAHAEGSGNQDKSYRY